MYRKRQLFDLDMGIKMEVKSMVHNRQLTEGNVEGEPKMYKMQKNCKPNTAEKIHQTATEVSQLR